MGSFQFFFLVYFQTATFVPHEFIRNADGPQVEASGGFASGSRARSTREDGQEGPVLAFPILSTPRSSPARGPDVEDITEEKLLNKTRVKQV